MKRSLSIAVIMLMGCLVSEAAFAALCPQCSQMMFTADLGKCTLCGGQTSSGAFKLCKECSDKTGTCQACGFALPGPKLDSQKAEKEKADAKAKAAEAQAKADKALAERADKRVKLLKENLDTFELILAYRGENLKPFYNLTVRVPMVKDERYQFQLVTQISKDDASKIIDHLAKTGYIGKAADLMADVVDYLERIPSYTLTLRGPKGMELYHNLGWGKSLIEQLEALKAVLPAEAAKQMDVLLERVSFLKKAD